MKSKERRAHLIKVAQSLFFERGCEDTTMVGIFSAAGVFKGGFCHHFASKEALFFGRLSQLVQLFQIALLEIATDNTKPTKDRLIDTIASEGQFLSQSTIGP